MFRILADVHTAGWTRDFPEISCQSSLFDLENKISDKNARVTTKLQNRQHEHKKSWVPSKLYILRLKPHGVYMAMKDNQKQSVSEKNTVKERKISLSTQG